LETYLEGVYWDLDGTIANTELEAHLPAFNNAFNDLGISWNWDTSTYINLLKINGGKNRIDYYAKSNNYNFSEDLILKIHEKKQFHYLEIIKKNNVKFKTGVFRLINELYKKKVRQFIVTSSSRNQVDLLVEHLFNGFNPFEFIISSEDVELKKPDPLPYLKAIKLSGIKKNNSIVFEDSNPGLQSSIAAKLPTIFVPSNIPIVLEENIKLDCILDTLGDEINVANVLKGPKLKKSYVDFGFLSDYLMTFSNAKN
jgi:HAD superfamily hydrolase (TIGR01509 family)